MSKSGRSDILAGGAVAVALFLCCGAPLLVVGIVSAAAGAGLIVQGAVLVGVLLLGLAAALGLRYALRRAVNRETEQPCAECVSRPAARHRHPRHAAPPLA